MSLREGNTGSRLQITLEHGGSPLVGEFDDDIQRPGSVLGGVDTAAGVVCHKSPGDIGGETRVVARWNRGISQHVDEALGHRRALSKASAEENRRAI